MTKYYDYQFRLKKNVERSEEATEPYGSWCNVVSLEAVDLWSAAKAKSIKTLDEQVEMIEAIGTYPFARGDTAYLLFIGWGEGDSFGDAKLSSYECVHLFQKSEYALLAADQILTRYQHSDIQNLLGKTTTFADSDENYLVYLNDLGLPERHYMSPYTGHFEHLDKVSVFQLKIDIPSTRYERVNLFSKGDYPRPLHYGSVKHNAELLRSCINEEASLVARREKLLLDLNTQTPSEVNQIKMTAVSAKAHKI